MAPAKKKKTAGKVSKRKAVKKTKVTTTGKNPTLGELGFSCVGGFCTPDSDPKNVNAGDLLILFAMPNAGTVTIIFQNNQSPFLSGDGTANSPITIAAGQFQLEMVDPSITKKMTFPYTASCSGTGSPCATIQQPPSMIVN